MAKKIYLSPAAHGHDNPCSYSKDCGENIHCNAYMDELEAYLAAAGFAVKRNPRDRTGDRLHEAIEEANAWGPDLYYIAHTNAGGGSYSKLMVYSQGSRAYGYAGTLAAQRRAYFAAEGKSWAVKVTVEPQWAELKQTAAPAVYDELVFHDHADQIAWFHGHLRGMAETTAKALCAALGAAFVDPYAEPTEPTKPEQPAAPLYRVQAGAFREQANAEALAARLKADGYAATLVQADGLYKVQAGAFADRANADALAARLKAAGYAAYIAAGEGTAVPTPTEPEASEEPEEPVKPEEPAGIRAGDRVAYAGRLYGDSYGGSPGKTVDGVYTVDRVIEGRAYGIHIASGWLEAAKCRKAADAAGSSTPSAPEASEKPEQPGKPTEPADSSVPEPAKPAAPVLRVGATVRYRGRLYATSTGGGAGMTVDGTYTVSRILEGKSHGVLLDGGLGWVRPADCEVVG